MPETDLAYPSRVGKSSVDSRSAALVHRYRFRAKEVHSDMKNLSRAL
jgi:hypothetical protein